MVASILDGCGAPYTLERWLESAGRREVYPEVICSLVLFKSNGRNIVVLPALYRGACMRCAQLSRAFTGLISAGIEEDRTERGW